MESNLVAEFIAETGADKTVAYSYLQGTSVIMWKSVLEYCTNTRIDSIEVRCSDWMTRVCSPEDSGFFFSIVTSCGLGNHSLITAASEVYIFVTACKMALMPTHSCIQWVPEAVPLRVKELELEPDHLLPRSANFKNVWWYNTLTPYILNE
jgi:hypothetical protein